MSQNFSIPYASGPEFLSAAQALLPQGDAWTQEPDAQLTALVTACVASLVRVHARCGNLTEIEAIPYTAIELLPAWEAVYNLPDPCTPANATIAQRQAAVKARMSAFGGQSEIYYEQVATALGYQITITPVKVWRYGSSRFGEPMNGILAIYAWRVNVISGPDQGAMLACTLNRIKPAYSIVLTNYIG